MALSLALLCMLNQAQASKLDSLSYYLQKHKLQLGLSASTDIAYRTLFNNSPGPYNQTVISVFNEIDKPKLGYSAGIGLVYQVKKQLSIETGLAYVNKGYKNNPELILSDIIDPSRLPSGSGKTLTPTSFILRYNYHYLSIPILAQYTWGINKLSFISSVGIHANFLLDQINKLHTNFDNGSSETIRIVKTKYFQKLNIFPSFGIGFCYKLTPTSSIRFEPTFQYGILKTIDAPVSEHLWSGGLRIGYYFGGR